MGSGEFSDSEEKKTKSSGLTSRDTKKSANQASLSRSASFKGLGDLYQGGARGTDQPGRIWRANRLDLRAFVTSCVVAIFSWFSTMAVSR